MHRSEPITLLTAVMQSYYCIYLFVCFLKSINPFFKLLSFYLAADENLFKISKSYLFNSVLKVNLKSLCSLFMPRA